MGIEPEKIEQIIEMHSETVSALNGEIDKAKQETEKHKIDASRIVELEKELEAAKNDAIVAKESNEKYQKLKAEFDEYKSEQEKKAEKAVKENAFKELLKDLNVSDAGINKILKWQGVESVEIGDDGKIANAKDLKKGIKEDWGEYITTQSETGADISTPPTITHGNSSMSIDEIMKIEDATERQKAIADNHELFGF